MDTNNDLLYDFLVERNDILDTIESLALSLERSPADRAGAAALFQAVHTLKSNFGILGFKQFEAACQQLETHLERVKLAPDASVDCVQSALALVDRARSHFDSI